MNPAQTLLIALCALLIGLSSSRVSAQSFYDVEGVIYGPNNTSLTGMAVFLEDITRSRVATSITDLAGRYRFSRITAGTYYVVVQPNDKEYRGVVNRIELINTTSRGSNSSTERLDITLPTIPRATRPAPGTIFAQDVPTAAVREYERAMESIAKKETDAAVERLNEALKIFPDYFLASQQLGLVLVEGEQYQQAIRFLVKAVEVNPKAGPSYLALGIASLKLRRPDLALDALDRARRLDDKSYRVHYFMGLSFLELNRLNEAENSLKESYKIGGPSKVGAVRLHLASIYSKQGNTLAAINELEGYLRDNPKAANADSVREAINKLKTRK